MARPKTKPTQTIFQEKWMLKTIESLEKDYWDAPGESSYLIKTCHQLRKRQLKTFETEDLRIMIGQDIGLKYLIPLALKTLDSNILAEGDFYEGDLLNAVLNSDKSFWKIESDFHTQVCKLFKENRALAENEMGSEIVVTFKAFEKIQA